MLVLWGWVGMLVGQAGWRLPQRVLGLGQELPFSWQAELSVTLGGSVSKFQLLAFQKPLLTAICFEECCFLEFLAQWGVRMVDTEPKLPDSRMHSAQQGQCLSFLQGLIL